MAVSNFDNDHHSWKQISIQLLLVVTVAFAGVTLATQAAFPETPRKSLSENGGFWVNPQVEQPQKTQSAKQHTDHPLETPPLQKPNISVDATNYLVADLRTGRVLAGKRAHEARPIASLTKLMTAVIARETISDQSTITITESAEATYGDSGGLSTGQSLSLSTLYYPLLLPSSNDAAAAIAQHANGTKFINQMNRKALALGMQKARFADASGLSANNVASAKGILTLARYIYNHHRFIFSITTQAQKTIPTKDGSMVFVNNHPLHSHPKFLGGKNGYTDEARHTLLSIFQIERNGRQRPIAIILLGSDNQVSDTRKLLRWTQEI